MTSEARATALSWGDRRFNLFDEWLEAVQDAQVVPPPADLLPGRMVVLQPEVLHSVEALEEGAFLLSIAYVGPPGKSD